MGAQESSQKTPGDQAGSSGSEAGSYESVCIYELMKQDLTELAKYFITPCRTASHIEIEGLIRPYLSPRPKCLDNLGSLTFNRVMGTEEGSLSGQKTYPVGPDGKRLKPCCACPETKRARDACIVEKGEEHCVDLIEAHKACMRSLGFNI